MESNNQVGVRQDAVEDFTSFDHTIWGDCADLEGTDFTQIARDHLNRLNELCTEDDEHCIKEDELCIEEDELCTKGEDGRELSIIPSFESNVQSSVFTTEDFCDKAINIDLSSLFTTDEVFPSRHSLVDWCQSKGRKMNTIIVTMKSDGANSNRKPRLTLGCERGGVYRNTRKGSNGPKKRDCATRKCNCPFSLRGVYIDGDRWKLKVECGLHNHLLPNTLIGHPYCGRLSKEEKKLVAEMTFAGAKPRAILAAVKGRNQYNASTMKTIYNAKSNLRTREMEGRTAMQQLMKLLVEKHYIYWVRSDERTEEVVDLFWAHPESILLAKCFPSVVIVDCTYKTNRYKMPLFAMVGITSTARTFSIAHCFLQKELEDNYRWALSKLKMLFAPHDLPNVFITDRECAVINAIGNVFPEAERMLCTWHISRNIEQHCRPVIKVMDVWTKFLQDWTQVIQSSTEVVFFERWELIKTNWATYKECIDYLVCRVFPHKERFVYAWTNSIKHRGNRTTNRAEGSHAKLKKHLDSSKGSFQSVWTSMDNMLCLQLNEVKAVFENSLGSVKQHHQGMLFRYLKGNLSHFALDLIKKEVDISIDIGIDPSVCDHVLRTVYGLPCAHELLQLGGEHRPIPIEAVDEHWRKLTILPNTGDNNDVDHTAEMVCFKKLYAQATDDEKKVLLRKLKEIATPATTSLREPILPIQHKGRPRGSKNKLTQKQKIHEASTKRDPSGFEYATTISDKISQVSTTRKETVKKRKVAALKYEFTFYLPQMPLFLHSFVTDIEDVISDGNCGFQCVAELLGMPDMNNNWKLVRKNLLADLERYKSKYDSVFGTWFYIDSHFLLNCYNSPCSREHWMVMPDIGYLIASTYNCVVILISMIETVTFFPHAEPPLEGSTPSILHIAFVNSSHFVKVFLKNDSPIPPPASMWNKLRTAEASIWEHVYADRINAYMQLKAIDMNAKNMVTLLD